MIFTNGGIKIFLRSNICDVYAICMQLLPRPRNTGRQCTVFDRFVSFFVSKITRKRLDRFAWNFQGMCGVTMGRPDYIFHQSRETAWCRDAQHGDGVCCALAPQLVCLLWSFDTNRVITVGLAGIPSDKTCTVSGCLLPVNAYQLQLLTASNTRHALVSTQQYTACFSVNYRAPSCPEIPEISQLS